MDTESFHVTILIKLGRIAPSVPQINSVTRIEPEWWKGARVVLHIIDLEVRIFVQAPRRIGGFFPDSIVLVETERRRCVQMTAAICQFESGQGDRTKALTLGTQ